MHVYLQVCKYYVIMTHCQLAVTGDVICQPTVSILKSDLTYVAFIT